MPKKKLPYEVKNNLDYYLNKELGDRMSRTGIKYFKENVMKDVAEHAEVGLDNIKRINRNVAQPSLAVAIKIADYFEVRVEDIFKIC
jgi:DNA-binding XRE family transcriptional regulator